MEALWKRALRKETCPFEGCDLHFKTCEHLDAYLAYDSGARKYQPEIVGASDVDQLQERLAFCKEGRTQPAGNHANTSVAPVSTARFEGADGRPVWSLFKKLRTFKMPPDQIGILVRLFGAGMNMSQVQKDMGWTSTKTLYKRYKDALETLKKRGFRG